jgi:hypothetical protein
MTTGTSPEPPAALRRWALAQFDLQPNLATDAARRELLKQLGPIDFVPSSDWDSALRVAGIAPCDGDWNGAAFAPALRAVEESVRENVDAFAAQFFSLPPEARRVRYQELLGQCMGMPAAAARLEALQPALEMPCELPVGHAPRVVELLDQTRRLFVLPRQERASRRLAFLRQCRANLSEWNGPASVVQRKFARYAALEPALFRELSIPGDREKLRQKIARQRKRSLRKTRATQTVARTSQKTPWWIWVVVVMALNGLRVGLTTSNKSANSPVAPKIVLPQIDIDKLNRDMNEQLQRGQPVDDTLRRLYGLPPQPGPLPGTPPYQPGVPQGSPSEAPQPDFDRLHEMLQRLEQGSAKGEAP